MVKDYSINNTTKIEREKIITEALGLSTLDAKEPSKETMNLVQTYVDGEIELSTVLQLTINRYKQPVSHS